MSKTRYQRVLYLAALTLLLLLASGMDPAQSLFRENRAGNSALEREDPEAALEHYTEAQALAPDDPRVLYNLGLALAQGDKPEEADQAWSRSTQLADGTLLRDAWFNRGVLALGNKQAENAAKDFVEALLVDPTDEEAQRNLELALKALQQQQQQQQSSDDKKNDKKDSQDQQQQKQQNQQQQQEKNEDQQQQKQNQEQNQEQDQEQDQDQQQNKAQDQDQQKPQQEQDQESQQSDEAQDQQQQPAQSGEQKDQDDTNKEMVERLLDQLQQGEKQALRRALRQQAGKDRKREKEW